MMTALLMGVFYLLEDPEFRSGKTSLKLGAAFGSALCIQPFLPAGTLGVLLFLFLARAFVRKTLKPGDFLVLLPPLAVIFLEFNFRISSGSRDTSMQRKIILVAEDNEDTREILLYRLKAMGNYQILFASNGKEALEVAMQSRPDLIIMDLKMPVMDGWEATKALRQTSWGKDLPVIALTAQAMKKDEEKALNTGCNDYIPKPIMDYNILRRMIEKLLK